jgi:hypothetical protein
MILGMNAEKHLTHNGFAVPDTTGLVQVNTIEAPGVPLEGIH